MAVFLCHPCIIAQAKLTTCAFVGVEMDLR